ncbi:cytochrome P450 4C1-like [Cardiocondyla obscurior]
MIKESRKKNFTQEEIYDNVITMLLTASDTITVAINFVIFVLANFPQIQEKVYEELLEIYSKETVQSTPIEYNDVQYMQYLERVIKETMRIFPPVPLVGRKVVNNIKLGKVTLLQGTNVIVNIIKLHRNEKYWSNPLTFDPDRFLPENIKNKSYCYVPFSIGPRNCIGMKYAMISMKVILATMVRTFVFKVKKSIDLKEIKLKSDLTLTVEKPLKVIIEKRYT